MLQFSYWLFPLISIIFFLMPVMRPGLLSGLLAACIAGAANSVALDKPQFAWLHAAAGALVVGVAASSADDGRTFVWSQRPAKDGPERRTRSGALRESLYGAVVWAIMAAAVTSTLPDSMWPYKLSRAEMLQLYIMFLPTGALMFV